MSNRQILLEMPWCADTTCPSCQFTFDFDARVETWPYNKPDLKKIINTFMTHRLYALDCPQCAKGLIHDAKHHKTYFYDPKTLKKISPPLQKFLADTKAPLTATVKNQAENNFDMSKIYGLKTEQISFKDYCAILRIDEDNVS
jgi:hypothetical protein